MASLTDSGNQAYRGFTLIELLVVMAIIATLLSIVAPRYFESADHARESALKANLQTMREAIDHYHGDRGVYPRTLAELVDRHYMRSIPIDPISGNAESWRVLAPPPDSDNRDGAVTPESNAIGPGIYDVRSGAEGATRDGVPFENL